MTELILGYAAKDSSSPLEPFHFNLKNIESSDVLIEILYCGICHTDIHICRNEWKNTIYPVIPGHEIIGRVKKIGSEVTNHKIGDLVGIGCIIGSCHECMSCLNHLEQYCDKGFLLVFNSKNPQDRSINYGGFASHIIVKESYALSIPKTFPIDVLPRIAPLLCAGITVYSPLIHWNIQNNKKVAILGIGGLGHLAIKIAKALGAEVSAITSSVSKIEEAKQLGASEVITKPSKSNFNQFDFILNTIPELLDISSYLPLLKRDGILCSVGIPGSPYQTVDPTFLIHKRASLSGSLIGSIKETQEMLEFCAKHNILADIELIKPNEINEAFEKILHKQVHYRFVIDMR